jgi:uncharacterized membrane protein YgaE (UPF0421/DUF939 family)
MLDRLSIKLLLPQGIVGIIAVLLVYLFAGEMSAFGLCSTLLAILAAQLIGSFFVFTTNIR